MAGYELHSIICAHCKCTFAIPDSLYQTLMCSNKITFYCPYGHDLVMAPPVNENQTDEMKTIDKKQEKKQEKKEPEKNTEENVIQFPGTEK